MDGIEHKGSFAFAGAPNKIASEPHECIKNSPGDREKNGWRSERRLVESAEFSHSVLGEKRDDDAAAEWDGNSKSNTPNFAPCSEFLRFVF